MSRHPLLALLTLLVAANGCAGSRLGARAVELGADDAGRSASESAQDRGDAGPLAASEGGSRVEVATAPDDETGDTDDKDDPDDGAETQGPAVKGQAYKHPLDGWTTRQIEDELTLRPEMLGSMSIGSTNAGALFNGMQMSEGAGWELVDPDHAWGTKETVDFVTHCLEKVGTDLPGASTMYIGHISGRRGGHLSPHISHQAGRDIDISYYYQLGQARWYAVARASNLDRERTWAFVKTLITDTDVELILMDRSVQRLVREHAIARGEDKAWVDAIFDGTDTLPPLVRHAKGHATHLHVRFYNPLAQETGRRAYDILIRRHVIEPPSYYVRHKVREGETLLALAKKYRVPTKAIQQANRMKSDLLRASQDYKIPQRGGVKPGPRPVIPARRVPPEHTAS